jgi:anti-sigma regulatory factor (Ser/Thr protein kinase)
VRGLDSEEPTAQRSFPADVASAASARRFTEAVLSRWGCDGFRDDALLLVSELVTNAATHANSSCEVIISHAAERLRIEVRDHDPRHVPVQQPFDVTAQHGRGLLIVERVAADWGTRSGPEGKVVWFELAAN